MTEEIYYESIKSAFEKLFKAKGEPYFEITAKKTLSKKLKKELLKNRDIIFSFLREVAPDITGFVKKDYSTDFIIIEVKDKTIKLENIYQVKKYAELFGAKYAFLVSTKEIPLEIEKLLRVVLDISSLPLYGKLILVEFDKDTNSFVEWVDKNPFEDG